MYRGIHDRFVDTRLSFDYSGFRARIQAENAESVRNGKRTFVRNRNAVERSVVLNMGIGGSVPSRRPLRRLVVFGELHFNAVKTFAVPTTYTYVMCMCVYIRYAELLLVRPCEIRLLICRDFTLERHLSGRITTEQ